MPQTRIIPSKPALILEGEKKSLIVTDIHIGFENTLASNEIFIGKNSTINETIQELLEIIDKEKPDSVILLGDVKSSIKSISRNEWDEVPMFFKKISEKCDVTLVPGNHDANIQKLVPDNISMISSTGMVDENIFPNKSGELEIIIIPSFNKYFYATHRKKYKKSISPIINKIKSISNAKIVTLDGTIIGDESIINQVI